MKFFIRTIGCKMNQLDSARIGAALQGAGHVPATCEEDAEYVLVNSCTVTGESDRKSRQAARAAVRDRKQVAVVGCGPRVDPRRWRARLPGTLQFASESGLFAHFGVAEGAPLSPEFSRGRVPVAIQTGCDNQCAFCITRLARGGHRGFAVDQIIRNIRQAGEKGTREVVLTGINLGAWGCGDSRQPGQGRLHELLTAILAGTTMPRVRLSSLGPQFLGAAFFAVFGEARICDHLHLSVQSGSPAVLKRMGRGHGVAEVYRAAEQARWARPEAALTADFIVGFPGETQREFSETLEMVAALGFAKLHVFPFSPREGAPAAGFPGQLPSAEKKARAAELREAGRRSRARFLQSQLGKMASVLVEDDETGLTTNYIRLRVPGGREGDLQPVEVRRDVIADRW